MSLEIAENRRLDRAAEGLARGGSAPLRTPEIRALAEVARAVRQAHRPPWGRVLLADRRTVTAVPETPPWGIVAGEWFLGEAT